MSADKQYRKVDDAFGIEDVGSTLLDQLAKGLYSEAEVLREYIQNAIDAHRIWKHQTGAEPEGPIQVEVRGERLSVIDYGVGMSKEEVRKVKSIAITSKLDAEIPLTGHKGVGIWAGLSYFETLILETTRRGDPFGYRLTIYFRRIVESISDRANIGEVMDGNYFIEEYDEEIEKHSTSVTLVNPKLNTALFTSVDQIREAIRRICPCEVDPNFIFYQKVKDWYEQQGFEQYSIVVDGEPVYRSYPSSVENFKPFSLTINDVVVAHGWQALQLGRIKPTHGELVGFRLIESGFTVGGDNPYGSASLQGYQGFTSAVVTYLGWHIGEIHIISSALRPNLQRSQLEESETSRQFIQKLRKYYASLEQSTRAFSDRRNAEIAHKKKVQETYKAYQGYDAQINMILNRQVLVDPTSGDITTLTSIQQRLLSDEQNANMATDTKEEKAYSYLRDKEVKELRKRLLKKLGDLLISARQKKPQPPPPPSRENPLPPAASVLPIQDKPQPKQPDTTTASSKGFSGGNGKNGKERADSPTSPFSSGKDTGVDIDSSLHANKREGNGEHSTTPIATELPEKEEPVSESAETEAESTENETFSRSTSRKIPVVIVLGFLENILNEELPEDSDVKTTILSKLTEKIDKVLSNVE